MAVLLKILLNNNIIKLKYKFLLALVCFSF
jgi:hypothetical protein